MIFGKVGRLGHGKTMRMVVDALALVDQYRSKPGDDCWLASNIAITVPDGVRFDLLPMDGFSARLAELMAEAREARVALVVAVDEIDTVWDAHAWQTMRKGDRYRLKQSRKYGTDLLWSAQFVDQVEKSIRNITEEVELVRAFPAPTSVRRRDGKRPWVIRGIRYRPGVVREIVGDAPDKAMGTKFHRYRRAHEALYDTDAILLPADLESLCAKHAKEEKEALCPRCHPTGRPSLLPFTEPRRDGTWD